MTIDIDGTPGVSSSHDVFAKILALGLETPRAVYTTSPGHFHVPFFSGDKNWTLQDKIEWIARWAGVSPELYLTDPVAFRRACTDHGIDMVHVQSTLCEYRVPGSVNYKRSMAVGHIVNVRETIWDTVAQRSAMVDWSTGNQANYPLLVSRVPPTILHAPAEPKPQIPKGERVYADLFKSSLPKTIKRNHRDSLSSYFYKNIGLLLKGACRINQIELAKYLKIPQPTISRLLRTLIDNKVLTLTNPSYIQSTSGRRGQSKTYGAGEALLKMIHGFDDSGPYLPGRGFEQSSRDIRKLSSAGFTAEQITAHVFEKYQGRVSQKYIESRVNNWLRKRGKNEQNHYPLGSADMRHSPAPERLEHSVGP
jgi:hypothetical protein